MMLGELIFLGNECCQDPVSIEPINVGLSTKGPQ